MTAGTVRGVAVLVCVLGIGGMIASSVAGSTGGALSFGLITATAVLCSVVATSVSAPSPHSGEKAPEPRLEDMVARLVEDGADEAAVRALVQEAMRAGEERAERA